MTPRTTIADDLKQKKPFQSVRQEVLLSIQRTSDELQGKVAAFLKDYGISPTQYNVLRILRGAEPHGHRCAEIGERMVSREPDITRLLARMEKLGWIAQHRSPDDRRVVITRITAAGLKLLKEIDKPISEQDGLLLGHMDEKKLKTLLSLLDEVRSGE